MKKQLKKYSPRLVTAIFIWLFFKINSALDLADMFHFDRASFIYLLNVVIIVFVIWEINQRIYKYYKNNSTEKFKSHRYAISSFITLFLVTVPFVYFIQFYVERWLECEDLRNPNAEFIQAQISTTFFIGVFIFTTLIKHFYDKSKKAELVHEQIQKENIQFKYESLRNQLNPHFLFNSFSVLSSLVYKNPDTASDFITQLSKIYRYVLEFKEKDYALLSEELRFTDSYFYLLKIRHQDSISIDKLISIDTSKYHVPSLSLQMLIENAAKHNKFSEETPLIISIHANEQYLVVKNTINKRTYKEISSTGIGLENIIKRYQLGNHSLPKITDDGNFFTVQLPLIKLEEE